MKKLPKRKSESQTIPITELPKLRGLAAIRERHAIARRVVDRIGQLCTTPHESKESFIRRVQSVIEWERAALSELAP